MALRPAQQVCILSSTELVPLWRWVVINMPQWFPSPQQFSVSSRFVIPKLKYASRCIIHTSVFFPPFIVRLTTNSIVHVDCFHWFLHSLLSHKSNMYSTSPRSPSYTLLLSNNVTLFSRGTRGYPRGPLGFDQFKILTVAGPNISLCVNSLDEPYTN